MTWIDGRKPVDELLRSDWEIKALVLTEKAAEMLDGDFSALLFVASEKQFTRISDLKAPEGWGAVVRIPKLSQRAPEEGERGLLLQGVNDPGNLGALIRIADWFGLDGVWVDATTADPYAPKTLRASMGSSFRVPVRVMSNFEALVRETSHRIVAAVLGGSPVRPADQFTDKNLLLLGSESHGLRLDAALMAKLNCVSIPRGGGAESLNVAMAGAILSWAIWGHALPSSKSEG